MARTPDWLADRIRHYYRETTEANYLRTWSREALAFHMGMHEGPECSHEQSLANTNRFLADRARIRPGMRVLDAGCGVGGSAIWLAQNRSARTVGITLEEGQVRLARRFAVERGVAALTSFELMDFMATTLEPHSFDVVWNIESVCYAHDLDAYLAHVRELLKPGGRFVCLDVFRGETGPPEQHQALSAGCVLPNLQTHAACVSAVRRVGFEDVVSEDVTGRVLRSAELLREKAQLTLLMLQLQTCVRGQASPTYLGHARGALGATDGFFSGAVTYGFVGAVSPRDGDGRSGTASTG
jgi:cyclopropane fatty-acyl-phospholipid synthase-like methyltransferase